MCVSPRLTRAQPSPDQQVDQLLQSMTLDQKAGQLFMVSIYGVGLTDTAATFLRQMMPGAVAMFTYNGTTPSDFTRTVNAWQKIATQVGSRVPLLVATDQEGGPVTRLSTGFTAMPWGAALGAMPTDDAFKVGQMSAEELTAVGINMNLAPVVDVRSPEGQFIERRTLGPDPDRVGAAASAYVKGMESRGVIGVLKHFPGHGPAPDSHASLPTITEPRDQVESAELTPFRMAIQDGADAIMVGHLLYPALDPQSSLPASLSPVVIDGVLRNELGFRGLAMTDAMDMGAILDTYSRPDAAVMAIRAGIDLIAAGPNTGMSDQLAMKQGIIAAVQSGSLPLSRVDDAVKQVLTLKAKYGLTTWTPLDVATAQQRVHVSEHEAAVEQIYLDTISIVQDADGRLPLIPRTQNVTLIYPASFRSSSAIVRLSISHSNRFPTR